MDPLGEEQLDYGEDEYGGSQKMQYQDGRGAIPALAEDEDDDYDDLYNDVNIGEGFIQTLQQPKAEPPLPVPFSNSAPRNTAIPSGGATDQKPTAVFVAPVKGLEEGRALAPEAQINVRFQGVSSAPVPPKMGMDPKFTSAPLLLPVDTGSGSVRGGASTVPVPPNQVGSASDRPVMNEGSRQGMNLVDSNGPTMLFVGELHWWTTDAELESAASQYGRVKEIKFFDERASGKSKGYCQLEFYDSSAASACKEGMNGFMFNGRACVVTYASAQTLRQMGAAYSSKNQTQQQSTQPQVRRPMNDGAGRGGMNYQGSDGGRNFGRGGWGRGVQGFNNRGPGASGPMRGRGVPGAKGMVGAAGAPPYGQGLAGPGLGGPAGGLLHPQSMMAAGFDPAFMGRGGPYGGFTAPAFPGMMPSFQAVNPVGLPGVAPHVNPAFFGRGMSANGTGFFGSSGIEGHSAGMWTDTSMVGWVGDDHGRRTRESSYGGDDGASDYGYGEVNHERGGRSNASREDRGLEREWSGNSERRHRDEKDRDRDKSEREHYREEKDGYREGRHRDRDWDNDGNYDRGQSSSRPRSKMHEEDHRSRSRDADYGKRRRLPSE